MNKEEEKIYQFNEYVLGYDTGLRDRSCLTISKVLNGNLYVMGTLYDGSADIISTMLDNLQQENERLKKDLKTLWNVCWNNDTEMTSYQNEIFDNYYDEFHKSNGGDEN